MGIIACILSLVEGDTISCMKLGFVECLLIIRQTQLPSTMN